MPDSEKLTKKLENRKMFKKPGKNRKTGPVGTLLRLLVLQLLQQIMGRVDLLDLLLSLYHIQN